LRAAAPTLKAMRPILDQIIRRVAGIGDGETGQTMAEYAILITVIAIVVLAAAIFLGNSISSIFSSLAGHI
jgi:Flp pilus assembly pilin Flp